MISTQIGEVVNFVFSHQWSSLHSKYVRDNKVDDEGEVFFESVKRDLLSREKVIVPRTTVIDFKGNYGPLPSLQKDDMIEALESDLIGNGIEMVDIDGFVDREDKDWKFTGYKAKNNKDVERDESDDKDDIEDEEKFETELKNGIEQEIKIREGKKASVEATRLYKTILPRLPTREYWSQYLSMKLYGNSMIKLNDVQVKQTSDEGSNQLKNPDDILQRIVNTCKYYDEGREMMKRGGYETDYVESIRHWAERLDRVETFVLGFNGDSGLAGTCEHVLNHLSDEYHKLQKTVFDVSCGFHPDINNTNSNNYNYMSRINRVMMLNQAFESNCSIIPIDINSVVPLLDWVNSSLPERTFTSGMILSSLINITSLRPTFNFVNPHRQTTPGFINSCIYDNPMIHLRGCVNKRMIHLLSAKVYDKKQSDANKYIQDKIGGRMIDTRIPTSQGSISEREIQTICDEFKPNIDLSKVSKSNPDIKTSEVALYNISCGKKSGVLNNDTNTDGDAISKLLSFGVSGERKSRCVAVSEDIEVSPYHPYDITQPRPSSIPVITCLHSSNEPIHEYLDTLLSMIIPKKHIGMCPEAKKYAKGIEDEELNDVYENVNDLMEVYE